ncbi:type I glutamate--ammonia ligase [Mycolicibacterium confluentis]|uniref:Glutamine synthetase n=1 Tax=Mycolicibacterium confluentis TaxID=28047 RepID=A0A7I7XS02_9MYCO|nr:glutamine synthetase family protein [Mycolicibacterium confluentis]MCV7318843.1 glutamine synthetase [Mycolicibacterium confluentis]ORV23046.1 glutamine synthetase [Mycolicibacterium confluentis]BBZ31995.1 glutamine synthetase [Mycolicibacterium confluentis]
MTDTVATTQLEVVDYDLGLRGKLARAGKTRGGSALSFCTILYGLSVIDDVTDTPFSNAANGYPDAPLVPDESTRIELPWRPGTDAVIAELIGADGRPLELSPRAVLGSLNQGYAELGLQPVLGFEYEMWLFVESPGAPGVGGALPGYVPFGRTENAYSLTRGNEIHSLATEFINRMQQVGIEVEMFHGELGPGFFEFTLAPAPAIRAADNAARARQYLRDLCAERGMHASFMSKPFADKSGAGGHVHSSLTRDGVNVFADETGAALSEVGTHYLAGLLAGMPDTALMMNPNVNSYKRIDPEMYTPSVADWGYDNRSAAARVLLGERKSARVEHRRPGADANPYLVAAALLAAGLRGLRERMALPGGDSDPVALPGDLGAALSRFEGSVWLPELLGNQFCASFAATRRAELQRYETWLQKTITSWELTRHLEHQ